MIKATIGFYRIPSMEVFHLQKKTLWLLAAMLFRAKDQT